MGDLRESSMNRQLALPLLVAASMPLALPALAEDAVATVKYACANSKTIDAVYYADKVDLTLSDGRTAELPQTMSGSGIRYANADESMVFWSKGDTAFITEGDPDKPTFADCVDETKK